MRKKLVSAVVQLLKSNSKLIGQFEQNHNDNQQRSGDLSLALNGETDATEQSESESNPKGQSFNELTGREVMDLHMGIVASILPAVVPAGNATSHYNRE